MTYSILSLSSGNVLGSYRSEDAAWVAAQRMFEAEPEALGSIAMVAFDDAGMPVETVEGEALHDRLKSARAVTA